MNKEHRANDGFSLEKLQAGQPEERAAEFARLVDSYSGPIYRLAQRILQNPQDAEDVLQDTFVKAYRNLDGFDGRSSIFTWLYRIATNEALMLLRKRKPEALSIEEPVEGDEPAEPLQIVDWCCLPEAELMSSEVRGYLDQAMVALPDTLKVVFLLRDIEGLSTAETAEVLNLSQVAVKTRLSRARLRLRQLLSSYFADRVQAAQAGDGADLD